MHDHLYFCISVSRGRPGVAVWGEHLIMDLTEADAAVSDMDMVLSDADIDASAS